MNKKLRVRILIFIIAAQLIVSAVMSFPWMIRSIREFTKNIGVGETDVKQRIYGDFYRTMTYYLEHIPVDENAVVMQPPVEFAHYFWVLNYYFLPRRIYELPPSGVGQEPSLEARRVRHAIYTRPDGFFFDRYPPVKQEAKP